NAVIDLDDVYFFVNPTNLAIEPPLSSAVTNYLSTETNGPLGGFDFSFNRLVLFAGNVNATTLAAEWIVDELRIGTTYADVVPFTGGPAVAPVWTAITPSGGGISLTATGAPNPLLTAEVSTTLGSWSTLGTFTLNGSGIGTFTDTNSVA